MNGTCNGTIFFGPSPLGPWGGAKRSNIIKSELQSQFQRHLNQTLCIFSQMKDILYIRPDFHSATWVMPRGGTWGYRRGMENPKLFFLKFNQIWCVSYLHEWQGAQWLSGRVLDSRPKGRGFESHRRHCVVVLEQDTFIPA